MFVTAVLIPPKIVVITVLIPLTTVVTAVLIPFQTVVTTVLIALIVVAIPVFIAFHFSVTVVLIPSTTVETVFLILFHIVVAVVLIPSIAVETFVFILFHFSVTVVLIPSTVLVTACLIFSHAVEATVLIFSHVFERKVLIPSHMFWNVCEILDHTSLHVVPHHPSTTLIASCSIPSDNFAAFTIPSNADDTMFFTASQHPSQSPRIADVITCMIPSMTFNVVRIVFEIAANVPSINGAINSHKPFHIVFIAFDTSSNVIPVLSIASFTPCTNVAIVSFMLLQISCIAFLKSSLVVQSVVTTPINTAIDAAAKPIGEVSAPTTVCKLFTPLATPPNRTFNPPSGFISVPKMVCSPLKPPPIDATFDITPPIPVDNLPKVNSTGDIAATMPPIVVMFFLVSSSRLKNLFARFVTNSMPTSIFGASFSPIAIATPSSALFIIVAFPARLSIMVDAIFSAAPSLS